MCSGKIYRRNFAHSQMVCKMNSTKVETNETRAQNTETYGPFSWGTLPGWTVQVALLVGFSDRRSIHMEICPTETEE
eukprot:UN20265